VKHNNQPATARTEKATTYQLTQLAAGQHRQRLAEAQRPAERARWPGPPAAPPARPGGCAPSSTPRPPPISDCPPATAGSLSPSND